MKKFDVMLGYSVSQVITVEAEDYESAIELAFAEGVDLPNISNRFEMDGDERCLAVYDPETGKCLYEGD